MTTMASQITSLMIVHSGVYSGVNQRKHQSPALLAFVRGIHQWPVNSPHKGPMKRKMFPFDDVIMWWYSRTGPGLYWQYLRVLMPSGIRSVMFEEKKLLFYKQDFQLYPFGIWSFERSGQNIFRRLPRQFPCRYQTEKLQYANRGMFNNMI